MSGETRISGIGGTIDGSQCLPADAPSGECVLLKKTAEALRFDRRIFANDVDVAKSESFLDKNHLPGVISFDGMPEKLQYVAADECSKSPPPLVSKREYRRNNERERNSKQVQHLIHRMLMPLDVIHDEIEHGPTAG